MTGSKLQANSLDVLTMGRCSVDLYGEQVGGRLEDMLSFRKYVGGSPTNMSIGASRLGLRAGLVTKVGDEQMGRFIREQLAREGVDVTGVLTDPERLTSLVLLGIRDEDSFPLIFYRENCADMALGVDDIDPGLIGRAGAVVVTGTHLSHPGTGAACRKALELARANGALTALDIDYRPNLWGLAGHAAGEERYIGSEEVTKRLQEFMPLLDLVVGTEEEMHIAGGSTDTIESLRALRSLTSAVLVCKRGADGASAFVDAIPADLDSGVHDAGVEIEVFNVLGAGDGFMAGLLRGWVRGEDWATALKWANICGAFAVSRHGCAPAYPTWEELQWYLEHGSSHKALRKDVQLEHIHHATTRRYDWPQVRAFAFDHRSQLEEYKGATARRIASFKRLCVRAAVEAAGGRPGYGILCDGRYGRMALFDATDTGLWVGRPVELPGSRPLRLEIGPDAGSALAEWPADHVAKVLCKCHPDDDEHMWRDQEDTLERLADACRNGGHELLVEIVLDRDWPAAPDATARVIERLYDRDLRPDWWKLEPIADAEAWKEINAVVTERDPWCRGVVVLGLSASEEELKKAFREAASQPIVRGFAVGRTIFAAVAQDWFAGEMDDETAVGRMRDNYLSVCRLWDEACASQGRSFDEQNEH